MDLNCFIFFKFQEIEKKLLLFLKQKIWKMSFMWKFNSFNTKLISPAPFPPRKKQKKNKKKKTH